MTEDYAPPDEAPRILHHDAQIVVVDKPAGLLSVPGRGAHLADCLIARLARVFPRCCWCTGWTATHRA
jgi:tRNA pseudouridine32 synthase / 23S rRNA pseudouridine746 synthase